MITTMMLHWAGRGVRVSMARELICPHCFRPLRPSAVRREPDVITLTCERCGHDVLQVELSLAERGHAG
jgi:RNase P subunit RPR2